MAPVVRGKRPVLPSQLRLVVGQGRSCNCLTGCASTAGVARHACFWRPCAGNEKTRKGMLADKGTVGAPHGPRAGGRTLFGMAASNKST